MSQERVSTHFDNAAEFEDLLTAAENSDPTGKEADFVADLRHSYDNYGQGTFLSAKQLRWLRSIAGVDE